MKNPVPFEKHDTHETEATLDDDDHHRRLEELFADLRAARELHEGLDRLVDGEFRELLGSLDSILETGIERYLRSGDETGRKKLERLLHALDSLRETMRVDVGPAVERAKGLRLPQAPQEAMLRSLEFLKHRGTTTRLRIDGRDVSLSAGLMPLMLALIAPAEQSGSDLVPFKRSEHIEGLLAVDARGLQTRMNRLKSHFAPKFGAVVEARGGGNRREYRVRVPAVVARRFMLGMRPAFYKREPER